MYRPIIVNAGNPQLRLLAEFIAAMANTNEEATARVLGDFRVARRGGTFYIHGPHEGIDAVVAPVLEEPAREGDDEKMALLAEVFAQLGRDLGTDRNRDNASGESDQHPV
jgi:hypothetical protein